MAMKTFRVKEIQPNPFRNMGRYPIDKEKIAALRESYQKTGFWGNVVCRIVDGSPEIAYGHHRWVAMKEEFGGSGEVELIVRKLDDDDMIQIMSRENMEEWSSNALIDQETVRAVVEAYGAGKISLPAIDEKTPGNKIRHAPSFLQEYVVRARVQHTYTTESLAEYLNWRRPGGQPSERLQVALSGLEMIEADVLDEKVFAGKSLVDARGIVGAARPALTESRSRAREKAAEADAARRRAEKATSAEEREEAEEEAVVAEKEAKEIRQRGKKLATKIGAEVSRRITKGETTWRGARKIAREMNDQRVPPNLQKVAEQLAGQLGDVLSEGVLKDKLDVVLEYQNAEDAEGDFQINRSTLRDVRKQLANLIKRAAKAYSKLEGDTSDLKQLVA